MDDLDIEYAIKEVNGGGTYVSASIINPKPYQLRDLHTKCADFNEHLVKKGIEAGVIRERMQSGELAIDNRALREWETGIYSGDTPDKDKRYCVVKRYLSKWTVIEQEETA